MPTSVPAPNSGGHTAPCTGESTPPPLDEISVWAAILTWHTMAVTGRIEVRFQRPARVDDPDLWVRGRVEKRRGKRLVITAELLSGEAVCASSEGLFIATETLAEMGIPLPGC